MTPIYQTSTYAQQRPGVHRGYDYSRASNPTRAALEKNLAAIEHGTHGFAFASGLAAIDGVLKLLKSGDRVIANRDLYGGTYRMFTKLYEKYGILFHFQHMDELDALLPQLTDETKLIWIETPTNPMLNLIDIAKLAEIAHQRGILLAVDNTFASPYLQCPLDLGADIVMHSGTKYLAGHSDVVIGSLVVKDAHLAESLYFNLFAGGAIAGPQDCFLTLRGIKTLHVRMQRHCENAMKIAEFLAAHNKVSQVFYPGLHTHKGHALAKAQMRDFGGMLSFRLEEDTQKAAFRLLDRLELFTLAESLGGVESLVNHPVLMTHAPVPQARRMELGITDSLIRLSVGIEAVDDLIQDLEQALQAV